MAHELENEHPKPAAIREVVALLDTLPAEFQINMYETGAHPCGTVACVGGAYAIARGIDSETYFTVGSDWLAQDLGFEFSCSLMIWADNNPSLWGTSDGNGMFARRLSYKSPENKTELTLNDIKTHWLGVADRIEALAN